MVDAIREEGKAFIRAKKYSEAEEAYTRGIEVDGSLPWVWSNRSIARYHQKKYADAAEDAKKAIELDETFGKAYVTRIRSLIATDELEEAMECLLEGKEALSGKDKQNIEQLETTIHRRIMARVTASSGPTGGGGVQMRIPWSDKPAWAGTLDGAQATEMASRLAGVVLAVLHVVPLVPLGGYERYTGTLSVALAIAANARGVMAAAGPVQFTTQYLQQALTQRYSPSLLTALTCLTGRPNAASLAAMWLLPVAQAGTQLAGAVPALGGPLSAVGRYVATSALGMPAADWDGKSARQRLAALEDPAHGLAAQLCLLALALGLVELLTGSGSISTLLVLGMLVYMQCAMNPHMRSTLQGVEAWGQENLPEGLQGTWTSATQFVGSFDPVEQARRQHEQQQQQQQAQGGEGAGGGGGIMGQLGKCVVS